MKSVRFSKLLHKSRFIRHKSFTVTKLISSVEQTNEVTTIYVGNKKFILRGSKLGDCPRENSDFALFGLAALSMTYNLQIHFTGAVSYCAYENIQALGRIWRSWNTQNLYPLRLTVESIVKSSTLIRNGGIFCLSGGVDSTYAAIGATNIGFTHALLIAGADYPNRDSTGFHELNDRVQNLANLLSLKLEIIETDIRKFKFHWGYFHTFVLAMCLNYTGTGLGFAGYAADNTPAQDFERHPWGNNHVVASYLSNEDFPILFRGGNLLRSEKISYIARHRPDLLPYISVCYSDTQHGGNCGLCRKCIDFRLMLKACSYEEINFFDNYVDLETYYNNIKYLPSNFNDIRAELMRKRDIYFTLPDGPVRASVGRYINRLQNKHDKRIGLTNPQKIIQWGDL